MDLRPANQRLVDTTLANIYLDVHEAATGNINQTDWESSGLERHQRAICLPTLCIYLVQGGLNGSKTLQIWSQTSDEDIQAILYGSAKISTEETPLPRTLRRYQQIAADSLMMLSILSFSLTFRHYCDRVNDSSWERLQISIEKNHESLEYFAKARGLRWFELLEAHGPFRECITLSLIDILGQRFGTIRKQHPHTCVVPEKGGKLRPPTTNLMSQINIANNESIYRADLFASNAFPRPPNWPYIWDYPSDPTVRLPGRTCFNCRSTNLCSCDPNNCVRVKLPLVELRRYPIKGVGVRTLQCIEQGITVGEYIGEIVPNSSLDEDSTHSWFDDTYSFALDLSHKAGDPELTLGHISAETYGNWTRYMNHSCEASVIPHLVVIGRKARMMMVTCRNIDAFEELTLDYGTDYWTEDQPCLCGTTSCISLKKGWIPRG